ncbi:hypothetical protein BB558_007461 [Smittium angustum]|uniref:Uncharacterized protein n=1 Tax=Smittium angustum TaxID=133377 RepID=A0A2U1IUZ7_SMIAN|nr:hypothetical protein BB558_007461 [Smittium angustum]
MPTEINDKNYLIVSRDILSDWLVWRFLFENIIRRLGDIGRFDAGRGELLDALEKYCGDKPGNLPKYLSLALWADRATAKRTTGQPRYKLSMYMMLEAIDGIISSRIKDLDCFDSNQWVRNKRLEAGDLVLIYDTKIGKKRQKKVSDKWFRPYRVYEDNKNGSYKNAKLD